MISQIGTYRFVFVLSLLGFVQALALAQNKTFDVADIRFSYPGDWRAEHQQSQNALNIAVVPLVGGRSDSFYIARRQASCYRGRDDQHERQIEEFARIAPNWRRIGGAQRENRPIGEAWTSRFGNPGSGREQYMTTFCEGNELVLVAYEYSPWGAHSMQARDIILNTLSFGGAVQGGARVPNNSANQGYTLVGNWEFREGFQGLTGHIHFKSDGTYDFQVHQGEIWEIHVNGNYQIRPSRGDRSSGILVLTPASVEKQGSLGVGDLKNLHDNRIPPASTSSEYRLYPGKAWDSGAVQMHLCDAELEPEMQSLVCANPWSITRDDRE